MARLIAGVLAFGNVPRLDIVDSPGRSALREERAPPLGNALASRLGHRGAAEERLKMTDSAAAAHAFHRNRGVPEFAGRAVRTVEDSAAGNDCSADARGDRQVDEVLTAARGSKGHLAESRDVRVALQEGRQPQARPQFARDRDVHEIGAHVWGLQNHSLPGIHGARRADADAQDRVPDV